MGDERLYVLLERIAVALEAQPAKKRMMRTQVREGSVNCLQLLIGTYIEHWQKRYTTKARPQVTKCIGVFKAMLEERRSDEIMQLLQVYCQMSNPWFVTKRHDIASFAENINSVVIARDKGYEPSNPTSEKSWMEMAKEKETKGDDGRIQLTNQSLKLPVA